MLEESADSVFERLRQVQQRAGDAGEGARALTSRLLARAVHHDKHLRQYTLEKLWSKNSGAVQSLMNILENTKDGITATNVAAILREVICLKQGKSKKNSANETAYMKMKENQRDKKVEKENKVLLLRKANNLSRQASTLQMISLNATQIFIRIVLQAHSRKESYATSETLLQDLIWVLASLSQKDTKFAATMRNLGCIRTMHSIFKANFTDNKLIFPLLVIMKQLSKNSVTTSILVRDGITATYERLLVNLGFIPTARLRLCLDAIDYFTRNKICCMQTVKTGLSHVLLRVLDRWDRYEGRMRLKICAHILQTLQHLCIIKAGRRALCNKKHVQVLHRFCTQCPDEPEFDGLLARVCSVITICLKHHTLPVPPTSPATFNLSNVTKVWPTQNEEDEDADNTRSESKGTSSDIDDDLDDICALPEDDLFHYTHSDTASDDADNLNCDSGESFHSAWINPNERDIDDLKRYASFFREFGNLNKQLRLVKSRSNSRGSITEDYLSSLIKPLANQHSAAICTTAGFSNCRSSSQLHLHSTSGISDLKNDSSADLKNSTSEGYNLLNTSTSQISMKIYKDLSKLKAFKATYALIASRVRSVIPFVKVAYPDMMGGQGLCVPEPLHQMDRSSCRSKLLSCVERAINPDTFMNIVAYDLDALCEEGQLANERAGLKFLSNTDEQLLSKNSTSGKLEFESRFESGNLRKAIQIGPREYELILMPDVNSNKRHQWFYFEVRNMQSGKPYIFNIINCEKSDSQFNFGMKPVMYSVKESTLGRPGWVRTGSDICYYRNSYQHSHKNHNRCYLTVTFTINFAHSNDVCYLAYHFPYTYSLLMTKIWSWSNALSVNTLFRVEPLCNSLNNNEFPVLTISAEDSVANPIAERDIIVLTARVHPGESNASWVMDGTLDCLLGSTALATTLRDKYVFKIVPMLNVEGVINGCYRCGLTNEDLNRRWSKPSAVLHPSIYHAKGLIEYLVRVWKRPPLVYCDYHGHSRKKNVFFYGCAAAESWCSADKLVIDQPATYLMLPGLMHRTSGAFSLRECSFRVERERESTARVAVWRQLRVARSYTMEASFCGFDQGPFKGYHLNSQHLQNVGGDFCKALSGLNENAVVDIQLTKDIHGNIYDIELRNMTTDGGKTVDSDAGSGSDSILRTDSDEAFD